MITVDPEDPTHGGVAAPGQDALLSCDLALLCNAGTDSRLCATPVFTVKLLHCIASYRAKPKGFYALGTAFLRCVPRPGFTQKIYSSLCWFCLGHTLDFTGFQQSFVWIHRNTYCNMYPKLSGINCVLVAF